MSFLAAALRLASRRGLGVRALSSSYAAAPGEGGDRSMDVFDRSAKIKQRDRAAHAQLGAGAVPDVLQAEVTERLLDRLEDCVREFPVAACIGGAASAVAQQL